MKFRSGLGRQGMMFPPYLEDLIEEDSPVRFIDEVVGELDLSCLESCYSDEGRPAYDPEIMLKVLLLAYSEGVFSSRQIAKKVRRDVGYMYLSGGERPDFRTINRFRLTMAGVLRGLFRQVVLIAKSMGLLKLGHIALDGSRRPAHAARGKIRNIDQLKDEIARLDKEIAGYQARCAEVDLEEDERWGDSDGECLPEALKRAASRREKLLRAKEELQANGLSHVNVEDPQCRMMKTRREGITSAYNAQIAADENQFVAAFDVVQNQVDKGRLGAMVDLVEQTCEQTPEAVSADNGFWKVEDVQAVERRVDLLVPVQEPHDSKDDFARAKFTYDPNRDLFICPAGKELRRYANSRYKGRPAVYYRGISCGPCSHRARCVKQGDARMIVADRYVELRERMRRKLREPINQARYKKRNWMVEPIFGRLWRIFGFQRFFRMGLGAARVDFGLICMVYNILRLKSHAPAAA